jgi:pilus assembly protein Flp/PilA
MLTRLNTRASARTLRHLGTHARHALDVVTPNLMGINVLLHRKNTVRYGNRAISASTARPKWTGSRNQPEKSMKRFITNFLADESGATAIEYGLLASLIAVVIIVGATALGKNINEVFNTIAKCIAKPATDCPTTT